MKKLIILLTIMISAMSYSQAHFKKYLTKDDIYQLNNKTKNYSYIEVNNNDYKLSFSFKSNEYNIAGLIIYTFDKFGLVEKVNQIIIVKTTEDKNLVFDSLKSDMIASKGIPDEMVELEKEYVWHDDNYINAKYLLTKNQTLTLNNTVEVKNVSMLYF